MSGFATCGHCKSQRLAQDKILVIDIISRQIIGEYEAGDSPDGVGYSSLVVGSGAGDIESPAIKLSLLVCLRGVQWLTKPQPKNQITTGSSPRLARSLFIFLTIKAWAASKRG